jgi:predicted TPR repeat methyltransferase
MALHRLGRLAEAERVYRGILAEDSRHAGAMHLLGVIACQANQMEAAEELIAAAISIEPGNAEYYVNLGEVQRRMGKSEEAIRTFQEAVRLAPAMAAGHFNLGLALAGAGAVEDAIEAYEYAIGLQPAYPEALNNLGLLLLKVGENAGAAEALERALALKPGHGEAANNLGMALWNLGRHEEALGAFVRAEKLRPGSADAAANLARACRKLGRRKEALAAFERAAELAPAAVDILRDMAMAMVEVGELERARETIRGAAWLAPEQADVQHALGVVLAAGAKGDGGLKAEAEKAYEAALRLKPEAEEWRFELANLRGETPERAPDAYVRALFDEYALKFEGHLVGELKYSVPWDLKEAVVRLRPGAKELDILDLGCGTGLCGELFRGMAREMTGVDISLKMVEVARGRKAEGRACYDAVWHGHITEALARFEGAMDVILAADVFIYVGGLEEVMPAAARALRAGGLFAFSLERHDGEGFVLRHRFAHSMSYVERVAREAGLTVRVKEACHLRNDVGAGWLVVLEK